MHLLAILVIFLTFLAIPPLANAAFASGLGSADASFGTNGVASIPAFGATPVPGESFAEALDTSSASLSQPIYTAGFATVNGTQEMAVAELNGDGSVNEGFGTSNDGLATASFGSGDQATAYAMAVNATSNTIVLAGADENPSSETSQPALAQFTEAGAFEWKEDLDSLVTIPNEDPSGGIFRAVAVSSNGDVLAAGVIGMDDPQSGVFVDNRVIVARFVPSSVGVTLDGYYLSPTLMSGGNPGGGDNVFGIAIDPSNGDAIVVGNSPTTAGCTDAFALAVTDSGSSLGTLDTSFGTNGVFLDSATGGSGCSNLSANAVLASSGSSAPTLVLGGSESAAQASASSGQALLIGLTGSGELDTAFGSGGSTLVPSGTGQLVQANALGFVPDSPSNASPTSIVASGLAFSSKGSTLSAAIGVARFELNGALDTTFGTSGTSTALSCSAIAECGAAVEVQPDANIDVAGGVENELAVAQLVQREVSVESAPTVVVSASTAANAQFAIDYNGPALTSGETVSVKYATSNGTAVAGTNFAATSGTATFSQGSATSVVVSVGVLVPSGATGSVNFSMLLSNAVGAGIGISSGSATIDYPGSSSGSSSSGSGSSSTSSGSTSVGSGSASSSGSTTTRSSTTAPAAGKGYWTVSSTGVVTSFGDAPNLGSVPKKSLSGKITGIASTASGEGFWLVSTTGHVYAFGNAHNYGSASKKQLKGSVIALRATPADKGYWLASSTGAVLHFGDAKGFGSVTAAQHAGSIVGFLALSSGKGYWLASAAGHVYGFGAAHPFASKTVVSGTVSAFAATSTGKGYWLTTRTGTVFPYGSAHTYPLAGVATKKGAKAKPLKFDGAVVAMTPTPSNAGYWLLSAKGTVYSFGNAAPYGSSTSGAVAQATT